MSFISRDAGEHITVLHYSGHHGNFFCFCECLGCVVAILNLCCRVFFSHLWSGIARTRCLTQPSLVPEAICVLYVFGLFHVFSVFATWLHKPTSNSTNRGTQAHTHTGQKTKQQQTIKHGHVSPRNSSRNFLCGLRPDTQQVSICTHLSARHFASVAATQRRWALQPRVTPHGPSISCALTLPVRNTKGNWDIHTNIHVLQNKAKGNFLLLPLLTRWDDVMCSLNLQRRRLQKKQPILLMLC